MNRLDPSGADGARHAHAAPSRAARSSVRRAALVTFAAFACAAAWLAYPYRPYARDRAAEPAVASELELRAVVARGERHLASGRLIAADGDDATSAFTAALRFAPGDPSASRGLSAIVDACLARASAAASEGDFEAATGALVSVLGAASEDDEATTGALAAVMLALEGAVVSLPGDERLSSALERFRNLLPRFVVVGNGTVIDTQTSLMWAAEDNGRDITWSAARDYAQGLRAGGYDDWRLPSIAEAKGLYRSGPPRRTASGYHVEVDAELGLTGSLIWTDNTRGSEAAVVYLNGGYVIWPPQGARDSDRALPVRSRK